LEIVALNSGQASLTCCTCCVSCTVCIIYLRVLHNRTYAIGWDHKPVHLNFKTAFKLHELQKDSATWHHDGLYRYSLKIMSNNKILFSEYQRSAFRFSRTGVLPLESHRRRRYIRCFNIDHKFPYLFTLLYMEVRQADMNSAEHLWCL
jgi:hypothetical protein